MRYSGIFCLSLLFLFCEPDDMTVKQFTVRTVAFYNVENLFDTINDTLVYDDDKTPTGKDQWTTERYMKKIANISGVLSEIGLDLTGTSPDIIGLCEVEKTRSCGRPHPPSQTHKQKLRNCSYGFPG